MNGTLLGALRRTTGQFNTFEKYPAYAIPLVMIRFVTSIEKINSHHRKPYGCEFGYLIEVGEISNSPFDVVIEHNAIPEDFGYYFQIKDG